MRILAVDDDPIALDLVRTTLAVAGYEDVTTARSAMAALATIASSKPFDVFLLDIQMPGADGIELCRQIRGIAAHRRTPILMITAVTDRASMDRAFAAGATDYVNKPFDPMELVVRIGIAERLARQEQAERASRSQIDFLRSRSGLGERIGLDDAFDIAGIPTLVSALEMENHLLRMPRLKAWRSRSYTIRIEGADQLHARLPPEAFYDLMADMGDAIAAALKAWPHVLSYLGSGVFAAVVDGPAKPSANHLREEIGVQVHAMGLAAGGGAPTLSVEVDGALPVGALLASLSQKSRIPLH